MFENTSVFFFDVCSLSEGSFKKKVWSFPTNPNSFRKKFSYNLTHLCLAISNEGTVYFQFIKGNMNSSIVLNFFEEIYRSQEHQKCTITIILDNAPMHKVNSIKSFCAKTYTVFRFLPSQSPFMNMAEIIFRFIKTDLRKKVTMK